MKGENLMAHNPPKEVTPPEAEQSAPAPVPSIKKPSAFSLNKFKSTRATSAAGLDNLVDPLPILKVGEVKDFFRVHPDEENYWSSELCFVSVPIKGMKKDLLHLIDEELAMQFLPTGRILRFRVALASKPFDILFFVRVPSVNMDNTWKIAEGGKGTVLTLGFDRRRSGATTEVIVCRHLPAAASVRAEQLVGRPARGVALLRPAQ
jgi:hypothetical protein